MFLPLTYLYPSRHTMPRIRITGITVTIRGLSRSLVSVDLTNPPCPGDVRWQINPKEIRANFPSSLELAESQVVTMCINCRHFGVSSSKPINIPAAELSAHPNQPRNFEEISVKVETEPIRPAHPTEQDESAVSDAPLQPTIIEIYAECPRFRILVIGKSGAGKSSLINMAFRVQEDEGQAVSPAMKC